jgi:hypothetical protein
MTRSSDESLRNLITEDEDLASQSKAKLLNNLQELQSKFLGPRSLMFILTNPKKVIEKLLEQDWSKHRLCGMVSAPLSVYKRAKWLQESHETEWKMWQDKRKETQKEIDDEYEKNEGTEKYNKVAVPWRQIVEKRDSLPKGSIERLLISFYTMIPPGRANYGDLFIYNKVPPKDDIPEQQNYIVLSDDENYIGLRRYKTESTYHENRIDIPEELVDEIAESLKQAPRTHMFVGKNKEPFRSENSFTKFACRVLEKVYNRPGLSITILRRMFVSKKDDNLFEKSYAERKEIARKMGHSLQVQERVYFVKKDCNKAECFSSESD